MAARSSPLREQEFYWLWILATATYGVGDVVTTIAIVQFSPTVVEANALVRVLVETFGNSGLAGLKIAVLVFSVGISATALRGTEDRITYYAPPVVLAVVGAFATAYNLRLLLG